MMNVCQAKPQATLSTITMKSVHSFFFLFLKYHLLCALNTWREWIFLHPKVNNFVLLNISPYSMHIFILLCLFGHLFFYLCRQFERVYKCLTIFSSIYEFSPVQNTAFIFCTHILTCNMWLEQIIILELNLSNSNITFQFCI